ncbi:MAG: endonuclease/exonuclease/phosphatase family protein, partial [Halalkalicoccus sp.]|nr:endonuclease/exonuclease/phosphatase family protein [Halalkalicoccus sp.]
VTWNCNMAFRKKKERLLQYDPDILVIQECESPTKSGNWDEFSDWIWVGENENKGLGVFSRNGFSLETAPVERIGGRFTVPITVDDETKILAVWAMNDERNSENRYIGQVYRALRDYSEFIDRNTVVAGDFNWNVVWDESPKSPLRGDFSDTIECLRAGSLQSAYHTMTDSAFGAEKDPTFFMHKKRDKEHHTDYIFVPEERIESVADFAVGAYDDWIDLSDHMPIEIEL